MKMSNPIIEEIFNSRVRKYVAVKLAEQKNKIRIAKLEANINKKNDIFDMRVQAFLDQVSMAQAFLDQAFLDQASMAQADEKKKQEDINLNELFEKFKLDQILN
jgi:hypothetical protein